MLRIPFLKFLALNLIFLASSFSLVFFLLFIIVACPLLSLFSSLCSSQFVHVMLALLVPLQVSAD